MTTGRKLFHITASFYEGYASWELPKEEKGKNLKCLSIIMQICNAGSLTETEEQKALHVFEELQDGLSDGTIKRKEVFYILKQIHDNLTEKNVKSKVISQLLELDYTIAFEETNVKFRGTLDHILKNISSIPTFNAKAISREIAHISPKTASRELGDKLHMAIKEWMPL